jgi:urease accessory protein
MPRARAVDTAIITVTTTTTATITATMPTMARRNPATASSLFGRADPAPAMTEDAALYRLMTWLTPSFPVGAFSYSHGLEWSIEAGVVRDRATLAAWIADLVTSGGGRSDAILLAEAWRASQELDLTRLAAANALALALAPSAERHLETAMQGRAFATAIADAWPCHPILRLRGHETDAIAYPVAAGAAAAGHDLPLPSVLHAYLHAFVANLVSAGVRLVPLGQTDGQRALAALEPTVAATAAAAAGSSLDDLGGAAFSADIASMRHETQYTRLFRS